MDVMDKLILEVDERAKALNDPQVARLVSGEITDVEFIKSLEGASPFYIRNGVLTTVDSPLVMEEIKRMQDYMSKNPPGLRVDGQVIMSKEAEVSLVLPELVPAYQSVKDALNDAKCVGCARNRELAKLQDAISAAHRADHASGRVRDVSSLAGALGQTFVDAWVKPPPAPNAPVSLARMSWAPSKNFQQVSEALQRLQTPVTGTPPGVRAAPPPRSNLVPPVPEPAIVNPTTASTVTMASGPIVTFKSGSIQISAPTPPPDAAINQIAKPDLPGGMRKHCFDCYGKHLMQAQVLMNETLKGYPEHVWLAVGHLAEAEDEILAADVNLADLARGARLAIMRDPLSKPDLMPLMRLCLERREGQKTG